MSDRERRESDDPLDALLAEARWPEPPADASRRVEALWDAISPAARRRLVIRPWLWAAAAACVALLTAGLLMVSHTRHHSAPEIVRAVPPTAPLTPVPVVARPYPSRAPNPWELAAMREAERTEMARAEPPKPQVAVEKSPPLAPVPPSDRGGRQQWLAQVLSEHRVDLFLKYVRDPATRDDALAATERVEHPPLKQLLDALDDPHEEVRLAAARVLGRIDGPITTAALVRRVNDPAVRREALAALMFSDGPEAATFLRAARGNPRLAAQVHSLELQRSTLQ